jgi:hypothetical protein
MPRPDNSRPTNLSTVVGVDFTGVESRKGGAGIRVIPGDYLLEVNKVEVRENRQGTGKYVQWGLSVLKGPEIKHGNIRHMTSLKPEQLWSLKGFLEDLLGKAIDQKNVKIDFGKYVGRQIGATVEDDDPYTNPETGKTSIKSKIAFTYPATEFKELGKVAIPADDTTDDDEEQEVDATESDEDDEDELETVDDEDL